MDDKLLICIGGSAGSGPVLEEIFQGLPRKLTVPVVVVRHMQEGYRSSRGLEAFERKYGYPFIEVQDKLPVKAGAVYFAPSGYHLLIEDKGTFALSLDERVNFCRPSVDLLFESAAHSYGGGLLGVVLSGANGDGGSGMETILGKGGMGLAQMPETADFPQMPEAALQAGDGVKAMSPEDIAEYIRKIQVKRDLFV